MPESARSTAALPKFAVLSHVLPPAPSGQAMALGRVLAGLRGDRYCLLARDLPPDCRPEHGALPGAYHALPARWQLPRPALPLLGALCDLISLFTMGADRLRQLLAILRRENCQALVVCSGNILNVPLACLAARRLRMPFYIYMFDDYTRQWPQPHYRLFIRLFGRRLLRAAAGLIVPNEALRDDYAARFGVSATVIHNPAGDPAPLPSVPWPAQPGEVRIVYTGAVNEAHYDAFRRLLAALGQLERLDLRLHVYTADAPEALARAGLADAAVHNDHVAPAAAALIQARADLLFLPLAFASPYPELVRCSAPAKLGDYLLAGRPILAHVPRGSYVAEYLTTHHAGCVVDEPDAAALAAAIARIIASPAEREAWGRNAQARAAADFAADQARRQFVAVLSSHAEA